MIHVMVRSITVGNIFHCQSSDELDDAGITRLEHPVDLLILLLKLSNKRVHDDLDGVKHCSPIPSNALRPATRSETFVAPPQNCGHGATSVGIWKGRSLFVSSRCQARATPY